MFEGMQPLLRIAKVIKDYKKIYFELNTKTTDTARI